MSEYSIIVSGFGGQGVLSAGRLIATAGLIEEREVSWLPSYGPEMRGGTANCSVIISDAPIGSPLLNDCDVLIALNKPSVDKFEKIIKPGGTIIYDSALVNKPPERKDINVIPVPASQIASDMGNMTYAGILLLGVLSNKLFCFSRDSFEKALYEVLPESKHRMITEELEIFDKSKEY